MELPDEGLSFEPPFSVVGMSGGVSCISANNGTCCLLLPLGKMKFWTDITNSLVPSACRGMGKLKVLTRNVFRDANDLDDQLGIGHLTLLDESARSVDRGQIDRWMGLSVAYRNRNDYRKAIGAERIAKQILFCTRNMEWLARSYRMTLAENLKEDNISCPTDGKFCLVDDKYAAEIGYRVQSCLDCMFALRDFLFSFLYECLYGGTKYSWRKLESCLRDNDRFALASMILPRTCRKEPLGKIAIMSIYRNVFFHYLGPSSGLFQSLYSFREEDTVFGKIPYAIYQLYDNLQVLMSIERGEQSFGAPDMNEEFERFAKAETYVDALNTCHESLLELVRISESIEKVIELASETYQITPENILSAAFTDEDGNVTRFRKGEDGELERF
jgi:hypothetical protein